MQQEQAALLAQTHLVVDENSQLKSAVSVLRSQLDVSQKAQQVAVASATSLQAAARITALSAANLEITEVRQSLLNAEIELSKTISSQKSYDARTQRELQLAAESAQQLASERVRRQRITLAEEMQSQMAELRCRCGGGASKK